MSARKYEDTGNRNNLGQNSFKTSYAKAKERINDMYAEVKGNHGKIEGLVRDYPIMAALTYFEFRDPQIGWEFLKQHTGSDIHITPDRRSETYGTIAEYIAVRLIEDDEQLREGLEQNLGDSLLPPMRDHHGVQDENGWLIRKLSRYAPEGWGAHGIHCYTAEQLRKRDSGTPYSRAVKKDFSRENNGAKLKSL